MNIETSNDEITVNTRPLFASAWIALFEVLRRQYNERHVNVPENSENPQVKETRPPKIN